MPAGVVVGPTYVVWSHTAEAQGAIVWGALDSPALHHMSSIATFARRTDRAAHRRAVVDLRAIERVDVEVLHDFSTLARERVVPWASELERLAFVVPGGINGLLLAGALSTLGVACPLHFSCETAPAFAFLDHPAASAGHASASALADTVRGDAILVARLHAQLRRDLVNTTLETAAASLGMSTRSLQRALTRLQTSFRDELRRVRVAAAEQLLHTSDLKIEAVAASVGFGNASRMSAVLRREKNVTASGLREHHRRADV